MGGSRARAWRRTGKMNRAGRSDRGGERRRKKKEKQQAEAESEGKEKTWTEGEIKGKIRADKNY